MELADMPVLETGSKECRFNSCHPHQIIKKTKSHSGRWLFVFLYTKIVYKTD